MSTKAKEEIKTGLALATRLIRVHMAGRMLIFRRKHYYLVGSVVLLMFIASFVEVSVWTAIYLAVGAIQGLEEALYFSTGTFTTLGYGDIVIRGLSSSF